MKSITILLSLIISINLFSSVPDKGELVYFSSLKEYAVWNMNQEETQEWMFKREEISVELWRCDSCKNLQVGRQECYMCGSTR